MRALPCPWGGFSTGMETARHNAALEIMEVLAGPGSGVQNMRKRTSAHVGFRVQLLASY